MGFSVDVAALAGLPNQLNRLEEDAAAGRAYLDKHTRLGAGEGIFNLVLGGHRTATQQVGAFFGTLRSAADAQSARVESALAAYRNSDLANAAKLDATVPAVPSAPVLQADALGSLGFNDRGEPQNLYTAPADYSGVYKFEMKWQSYLSPTSYVRALIWEVTQLATRLGICDRPIDPFVEWFKPWLGDWAGFRACAEVHEKLGKSTVVMSANVRSGAVDSQFVWKGNAADRCRLDLGDTGQALDRAETKLAGLSSEYRSVAESTLKLAESMAGLVVLAIDLGVMALMELSLAAGSAPTVVGTVAFGAAAAATVWKIIEVGMKILDCIKLAEYGAKAFSAGLDGFSVIDPQGPMPALAASGSMANTGPATSRGPALHAAS